MASTKKQIIVSVSLFSVLFVALVAFKVYKITNAIAEGKKHGPPMAAVTTITVQSEDWPQTFDVTGSLAPVQGVTLSSEGSGKVAKINFESGQEVKEGDILIELDSSVQGANYKAAQTLADQAKIDRDRAVALRARGAVSQADVDTASAHYNELFSTSESLKASLGHMNVTAPFSGRTGIRQVNLGQYVSPGTPIVPLMNEDKLYLNFTVPQRLIGSVSVGREVSFLIDAYPNEVFKGKVSSFNPNIDESTRNISVQAIAENTEKKLRPGLFAHIYLDLGTTIKVVPVPATSINYAPYGNTIFVVERKKTPEGEVTMPNAVVVKVGPSLGDQVGVISGLKGGEEIVTSGMFKIIPGVPLIINNSVAPANDKNPKPENT